MITHNVITFPDRVVSTLLLLMCETSCPPQQQQQGLPAAVQGLWTTDAKLHCCCWWCCSPVLLLLWFGHTHAHKNCASDLWLEGIHTTSRDTPPAGCAARRPWHLPSRSDRAQTLRNTTSYITTTADIHRDTSKVLGRPLRRRLSECPSCKSRLSMCLAHAASRHVCFMSLQAARS